MGIEYARQVMDRVAEVVDVDAATMAHPESVIVGDVLRVAERMRLDVGVLFCQFPTTTEIRLLASAAT